MMAPVIQLVAFEDRYKKWVFVRVPNEKGRYVRTDPCVVQVECPACKAAVGELCKGSQGYWAGTHGDRRSAAVRKRNWRPSNIEDAETSAAYDRAEQSKDRDWLYV